MGLLRHRQTKGPATDRPSLNYRATPRLYKWGKDGTWDKVQRVLREGVRQTAGREAIPSLACVDSQSVKGTECGGDHGIDGHKKINGVKRHILVDTMGLLLAVVVTAASVTDAKAAREVFQRATAEGLPRLAKALGDHVYGNEGLPEWTADNTTFRLEITVKDPTPQEPGKKKFQGSSPKRVGNFSLRGGGKPLFFQPGTRLSRRKKTVSDARGA